MGNVAGLVETMTSTQHAGILAALLGLALLVAYLAEALDAWRSRARSGRPADRPPRA